VGRWTIACVLALAAAASAQDRIVTAMRSVTDAERTEACVRDRCHRRWSGASPSGRIRARVVSRESRGEPESTLVLEVARGAAHWELALGESGHICGGTSEGSRSTSWVASRFVDFHGAPEPELFVDVHESVHGPERSVSQMGTTVCSLEAVTPSCHTYVGGDRRVERRTFGTRGAITIGDTTFAVPFLP
jgi:hypothetical protein